MDRIVTDETVPPQEKASRRRSLFQGLTQAAVKVFTNPMVLADFQHLMANLHEHVGRLRWPMAWAFKRLKSLLHIDALRAFDPDWAQTYLFANRLGAVIVDGIRPPGPDFSP